MLRIFADDPDNALALNDFAFFAHRLNGRSYLHAALSFLNYILINTSLNAPLLCQGRTA